MQRLGYRLETERTTAFTLMSGWFFFFFFLLNYLFCKQKSNSSKWWCVMLPRISNKMGEKIIFHTNMETLLVKYFQIALCFFCFSLTSLGYPLLLHSTKKCTKVCILLKNKKQLHSEIYHHVNFWKPKPLPYWVSRLVI